MGKCTVKKKNGKNTVVFNGLSDCELLLLLYALKHTEPLVRNFYDRLSASYKA